MLHRLLFVVKRAVTTTLSLAGPAVMKIGLFLTYHFLYNDRGDIGTKECCVEIVPGVRNSNTY